MRKSVLLFLFSGLILTPYLSTARTPHTTDDVLRPSWTNLKCFSVASAYDFPALDAAIYFLEMDSNAVQAKLTTRDGQSFCAGPLMREKHNLQFACELEGSRFDFVVEDPAAVSATYASNRQYAGAMKSPRHFFGGGDVLQSFVCKRNEAEQP